MSHLSHPAHGLSKQPSRARASMTSSSVFMLCLVLAFISCIPLPRLTDAVFTAAFTPRSTSVSSLTKILPE